MMTYAEAMRHIRLAKSKVGFFALVRTEALYVAGYGSMCGDGYLTLVHKHLI